MIERRNEAPKTEAWAPYWLAKARVLAGQHRAGEATAALARVHRSWRAAVPVVEARLAVAQATGDAAGVAAAQSELNSLAAASWPATDWQWRGPVARLDLLAGADAPGLASDLEVKKALLRQGKFVLGDLVTFRQVGIKVVFPGEDRFGIDPAVGGQGHFEGELHRFPVQDRERTGHPQADLADMGIGRGPEGGGAAAEYLAGGEQVGVDLQPDNGLVFQSLPPEFIPGSSGAGLKPTPTCDINKLSD